MRTLLSGFPFVRNLTGMFQKISTFCRSFLNGELHPYLNSEPIPTEDQNSGGWYVLPSSDLVEWISVKVKCINTGNVHAMLPCQSWCHKKVSAAFRRPRTYHRGSDVPRGSHWCTSRCPRHIWSSLVNLTKTSLLLLYSCIHKK